MTERKRDSRWVNKCPFCRLRVQQIPCAYGSFKIKCPSCGGNTMDKSYADCVSKWNYHALRLMKG